MPDQTKTTEDPQKARIYVLRPGKLVGGAVWVAIYDEKTYVGSSGAGGYLCWERQPGETTISTKFQKRLADAELDLSVEAGRVYYVIHRIKIHRGWFSGAAVNELELLDENTGKKELGKCKPAKYVPLE